MSTVNDIGVLGATSHVGLALLSLLESEQVNVFAFSRKAGEDGFEPFVGANPSSRISWTSIHSLDRLFKQQSIPYWISLAPIQVLPAYFDGIKACGAKRIVVLSSTSRFTKHQSPNLNDQALAQSFIDSEAALQNWAEKNGIEFVILRPTLIYGLGKDKNICEITRLIRKFGFFPLLGDSKGLRQPVHCHDVAVACLSALRSATAVNNSYNLSGAERLSYRNMVERIFLELRLKPRFFKAPIFLLRAVVWLLRLVPRYRNWSFAMVERMNKDMVFDHEAAARDLGFRPRPFVLNTEDLP
ncbi:MAG: NAD-dependent epimerase/dehydratase family protein [Gammaproteobacteria bacterium]